MTQPEETAEVESATETPSEGAIADEGSTQDPPAEKKRKSRWPAIRRTLLIGGAFILGFVILGVIAIQVWEYSNSVAFCANACHDVHPEEIAAFEDSFHANVKCTECHMGRVGTLQSMVLKAGHFGHLPAILFDTYGRPLESETMRPANESCERCHWPPAFHGDTVREIVRFEPDEENTEKRTYLLLKTGAGERAEGLGYGIHWHITNPVEYIASDEHKQDIHWVRSTLPDGRTVTYHDAASPHLTEEQVADAEIRTMDCVDCHNRVGHPFPPPEDLTDAALDSGALSRDLPYAKREMYDLLSAPHASRDASEVAVDSVRNRYEEEFPDVAESLGDEIDAADELARELLNRLVFDEPGISWKDFPDNNKHKDFPGCFRCHDGKHFSDDGEPIRLHCNICHSIPITVQAGDRPPSVPITSIEEPASHREPNFMADHRFQADASCEGCHGEVEFGSDDSSFCADSSCHGRAWPLVELDAGSPHPIELEGKHAEVWCHNCHEGVRKPDFQCANCHEPPTEPHFGPNCEECHTPAGFQGATWGDFQHPFALEDAHAQASCADCHKEGADLTSPSCSDCHEPPSDSHYGPDCEECHTPAGFAGASLPPGLHPIPLVGAHQTAPCEGCHTGDPEPPELVCSKCHERPEDHLRGECGMCHSAEGWAQSASFLASGAPQVTHELEGREDCFMCHDPKGEIQPAPSNHVDYTTWQCGLCHK